MIAVRELCKNFGGAPAVAGISFDVLPGETFGLLGPNGAGKTTTIGMMIGVIAPDAGTVIVNDAAPSEPSARRVIGIAPQSLALYEEFTAVENLRFFARVYGLAGQRLRDRIAWCLGFVGLENRNGRVATFSGGMKRRLNLAVALVHDPRVIFLDEPTVGVDPQSRNHIYDKIEQLKDEGRTILYTTHYMEEAQRLCDRVAIMDNGKILDLDTVDALVTRHGGRSMVQALLARPPADGACLPGLLDGLALRFESDTPLEEIGRLSSAGVEFQSLEVSRPDLENVFLTLTGRSLRD